MNRIILLLFGAGVMIFLPLSCSTGDDGNQDTIYIVPSGAVSEYIATSVSSAAGGINDHLENAAVLAGRNYSSGVMSDSSFIHQQADTSAKIKYNYNVNYSFGRTNTSPPKFILNYDADGWFTGPLVNSSGNLTGQDTITGLDTVSAYYLLHGTGDGGGSQESKHYNVPFTSTFRATFNNVVLDKVSHMVVSGSATLTASGRGPASISFSYNGILTFLGNRLATLVFNGKTYQVDLTTATITE